MKLMLALAALWLLPAQLALAATSDAAVAAASSETAALQFVRDADALFGGYADYQVQVEMRLRQADGRETVRQLRVKGIEISDDGDRTLLIFDEPKDQRGTALLSYAHRAADDEQWLFLPALNRVKRIIARNRSGPFVGSEFAFEDLLGQEIERYRYRLLDQGEIDGAKHVCIERVPNYQHSGYTRQVVWYDAEKRIRRIEYFDRRNELLKTYDAFEWQRHAGRFWRPARMLMTNHQTHKLTELRWREFRFNSGMRADTDFSVSSLSRVR